MLSPYTVTIYTKQDNPYNVVPDAPIEIRERLANGTAGGLSLIYKDQEGLMPIQQTGATADERGQFTFFIEQGEYVAIAEQRMIPIDVNSAFGSADRDAKIAALEVNDAIQDAEIADLQAGQAGGIIVFSTYALLDAYTPQNTEEERTSYKVTNDPDTTLNGYYSWVSGTTYTKDASLVLNSLDVNNNSDAISGKAVGDFIGKNSSYVLSKSELLPTSLKVGDEVIYQCDIGVNTFNGITDESGDDVTISLTKSAIVKFTRQVQGFNYEIFAEYDSGGLTLLSNDVKTSSVLCKNACFRAKNTDLFKTGSDPISIEVDFVFDHDYGSTAALIGYGGVLTDDAVGVGVLSDYSRMYIGVGSISTNLFYLSGLVMGERYHVIYTVDALSAKLYVNGQLTQEKPTTAYTLSEHLHFNIGGVGNTSNPTSLFRSPVKLVRYYNRALTASDVIAVYNAGDTLEHYNDSGNILELNAASCNGSSWLDTSGKENHPFLVIPSTNPALSKVDVLSSEDGAGFVVAENLNSENLFNIDNVMFDTIIDSSSGALSPWVGQTSIAGVVKFTVSNTPEWYRINGIDLNFGGFKVVVAGYNELNQRLGILELSEINNNTFRTFRANGLVGIVYAMIYRLPSNSGVVPELNNIYIEKLESETDFEGTQRSNNSNDSQIDLSKTSLSNINSSNEIATLSGILSDKKLLVLGDSITANGQWLGIMTKKLGITKVINSAIGGGNIYGNESPDPLANNNRHLTPQLRFSPFYHDTKIRNYGEFNGTDYVFAPDNVIISMGFNDANNAFPIGDWSSIKLLDWRTMPLDTVQAYLRYNIEKMINDVIDYEIPINSDETEVKNVAIDCRLSKVIYQIPIHTGGDDALALRLQDVRDAIKEVCVDYSIPIINARDNSGISRFVEVNQGGRYLLDTIHPNAEGYKKLAECNTSAFVSLAL